jgi:carboxyl-terminal processing protease
MTHARGALFLVFALLVGQGADSHQQTPAATGPSAEKAVSELEEQVCTALRTKNRDLLRQLLSEDFVCIVDFDLWDREYIVESHETPHSLCHQVQMDVNAYGTAASAFGFALNTRGEQELISDTWIKRGDEWHMVFRRSVRLDTRSYLEHALDLMERNSWKRTEVNWPALRTATFRRAAGAKNSLDAYDALRLALSSLGDHHSHLLLSPALQSLEANDLAGKVAGRKSAPIVPDYQTPHSPYIGRYEPEGRIESLGDKTFAVVVVPKFPGVDPKEGTRYSEKLQQIIAELDSQRPSGWVVDLRGNVGGNMWPMLAGIGPVLGESSNLGGFLYVSGATANWSYRDGIAGLSENGKDNAQTGPLSGKPYNLRAAPAVAVLVDSATGSSGEAVAIAFRGRPRTRFFGERTAGFSTVNRFFALADGAILNMTVGVDTDRNGKAFLAGISPDELLHGSDTAISKEDDPIVRSALEWLSQQPPVVPPPLPD